MNSVAVIILCVGLVYGNGAASANEEPGDCQAKMTAFPPDPSSKCCGLVAKTSDGGTPTLYQHPWAVIIDYETKKGQTKRFCGGALISGKYVVTAAQCITGFILKIATPRTVLLGDYDYAHEGNDCVPAIKGGEDCNEGVTRIEIERTIPHPEFNPSLKRNDIGLIRLKETAPYTDFIRPICLPTRNLENTPPAADSPLYAIGWGRVRTSNNVRVQYKVPFVNQEKCQKLYSNVSVALWKGQLCAGGIKGIGPCMGDSGGPLVYENQEGLSEISGIISFGSVPCARKDFPDVFSNVYEYLDWIKSVIVS